MPPHFRALLGYGRGREDDLPAFSIASRLRHRAFSLIELLVVIAIVAVLIAILLPALLRARDSADTVECASQMRQVAEALILYAGGTKGGEFPPNTGPPDPRNWYDLPRVGQILALGRPDGRGRILACPADADAMRTYAMNYFASSAVDAPASVLFKEQRWKLNAKRSSQLILLAEKWSGTGPAVLGWAAGGTVGSFGDTPEHKFGGGVGLMPPFIAGRWGPVKSEIAWWLHRKRWGPGKGEDPVGRANFAFADGHVELKSNTDVVDPKTGEVTGEALWTP